MALPSKVLVANRGEIAIRIFRTLRELGDRLGRRLLGGRPRGAAPARRRRGVSDRPRPGGGELSRRREDPRRGAAGGRRGDPSRATASSPRTPPSRARSRKSGLTWIGPPSSAIELMGSKTEARTAMQAAGVPIIPGATEPVETVAEVLRLGEEVGYPLIVKAAAGGGGKGMKLVASPDEAERAFESAQREGEKYFADGRVYVERYLEDPRHVEVQVLADAHGNVIHLGERDCTIQRRHQKLIEETPSPAVDAELRARIGQIAVDAARAAGYRSAGTIEGLLTADGSYYFMEMNTRIQVEHTVTEEVTGIDLVREQVLIAAGEPLSIRQEDVCPARPRDRVPDQRRGRVERLPARAGPDHRLPRAVRPGCARRLGRRRRLRDQRPLRPDDRQADRPRRRPRARPDADAARARRVRDRRPADAARLPPRAALASRVHRGRHRPRPRRVRGARPPAPRS